MQPGSPAISKSLFHNISHVYWDLDHTLWDYETNARITIYELYDKFGLNEIPDQKPEDFHTVYCKHNDLAWERYRDGKITKEDLRKSRFRDTFFELGMIPDGISDLFEHEFVELCPQKPNLMDGAMDVLRLFSLSYTQHIITNGFRETQAVKLKSSGIDGFFSTIVHSDEIGYQKPHPLIFHNAMSLSGAKPEESLMIGDNFEADVLGAYKMGMKCIYFNPKEKEWPDEYPGIIAIKTLKQLLV